MFLSYIKQYISLFPHQDTTVMVDLLTKFEKSWIFLRKDSFILSKRVDIEEIEKTDMILDTKKPAQDLTLYG